MTISLITMTPNTLMIWRILAITLVQWRVSKEACKCVGLMRLLEYDLLNKTNPSSRS